MCETFNVILDQLSVALQNHNSSQFMYAYLILANLFLKDFRDSSLLADEIIQFLAFVKFRSCVFSSKQVILLHDEGLTDTFPSINVVRRISLSMMASNCSEEKWFSNLSLRKNILRASMTGERLSALFLLNVQRSVINKKDRHFDYLVKEFTEV